MKERNGFSLRVGRRLSLDGHGPRGTFVAALVAVVIVAASLVAGVVGVRLLW